MRRLCTYLALMLPAIWFGLVIAISFIEAPLKFQAPDVTLATGLSIGRLVFSTINNVEILLLLALTSATFFFNKQPDRSYIVCALALLLFIQTFVLLPALDKRAVLTIQGVVLPPSSMHSHYVIIEIAKALLLLAECAKNIQSIIPKQTKSSYNGHIIHTTTHHW